MQLHLRIIEAKDIAKMDTFGKTDAYCIVNMLGAKDKKKTKVIKNDMTPIWNEEMHFPIPNPGSDAFHILMRDEDVLKDDDMATLEVQTAILPHGVVVDRWFNMTPVKGVKKGGQIHLIMHMARQGMAPFVNAPDPPLPPGPYAFHVRVIAAEDIAKMDTFGKTDAYCILTLGGDTQKTTVKDNCMTPRWDEDFKFNPGNDPRQSKLQILMKDKDLIKDDDMANLQVSVAYLPFGQPYDQWYDMKPVKGVKKGGRLHLLLHLCQQNDTPFVAKGPQQAPPPQQQQQPPQHYPPQGYPQQQPPSQGYPPQQQMYPPQQPGMQPGMYPPQQGYPQQPMMYPPQQGYPQQPGMYPPQQGYPQQPGMQPGMYPPQQQGYPQQGYPQQPGMYPQQGYPPR